MRSTLTMGLSVALAAGSAALSGQEWTTSGLDAQRTAWVRGDDRLNAAAVTDGTFRFLWKAPFDNRGPAGSARPLSPPVLLDRLIGYRGFKTLAFLGGSSDRIFAIDTDLARPAWTVQLNYSAATGGVPPATPACPGGLTATPSRRTPLFVAQTGRRGGGGGRGRSTSAVGEPGRGAAILSQPPRGRGAAPAPPPANAPRGGRARGPVPAVPFGGVDPIYVVGHDGFLHVLRASNGSDAEPAMPFLPPGAMPSALVFVDGVVYTTTSKACGAAPNGVWAIDLTSPERKVTTWRTGGPDVVGDSGLALGGDGTIYVATGPSSGDQGQAATYASAVVALDPETLVPRHRFSAPGVTFSTSPMVIRHQDRDLVAIAGDDGRLYLLDGAALGGADHRTPLHVTAAFSAAGAGGALAAWEDQGTRWVLAPAGGPPKTDVAFASNGSAPNGRVVAFKLTEQAGRVALEPAWASRNIAAPVGPIVVNGIVLAIASGEYRGGPATLSAAERAKRSSRAVLYALDGATGKELWGSASTITSFATAGLVAGGGQVYVVTNDSTLYAFGIPMEH